MPWRRVRSSVGQICVTKLFSSASTRPWTRQSKQSLNCPQRGTPLPEDDPNKFTPAQGIPSLAALTTRTYQPVEMQAKEPGKDMPGSSCEGSSSEHLLVRPGRRPKRKTRGGESRRLASRRLSATSAKSAIVLLPLQSIRLWRGVPRLHLNSQGRKSRAPCPSACGVCYRESLEGR